MIVEIFSNTRHRIISTVEFEEKDTIFEIVLNCIENFVSSKFSGKKDLTIKIFLKKDM